MRLLFILLLSSIAVGQVEQIIRDTKMYRMPFCPPHHDWCWSDTSATAPTAEHMEWYVLEQTKFSCSGICRVCLSETTAVWSYAEDIARKQAAKKLTEYERLKQRKGKK